MSVYMTEEEQLIAIKKWWQRYNTRITVVVALFLLAFSGYKYWMGHQEKVQAEASRTYESLMVAFSNHEDAGVKSYANQLIQEYGNTVYGHAARLTLARLAVIDNRFDDARNLLAEVSAHSRMPSLQQVARIRMARILIAEKSYDKALSQLEVVDDIAYKPLIAELKGDVFAATGKYEDALVAYRQAMSEVRIQGIVNSYLEMKTSEIAALTQSSELQKEHDSLQTVSA